MREWLEPPDVISIHALHEESDSRRTRCTSVLVFQSTLSMRRATRAVGCACYTAAQFQSTLSMRRATVQLDIFVRFLRRKPAA